ncbi:MAG: Hsp20 family protein [Proteobacteria bacterium]|nr:Hsp20 family protein [Pseudomonadota bacterium]
MNALDLTPVFRSAIGFDRMASLVDSLLSSNLETQSNWPPYNIEKSGNNNYRITMAVAGFGEDEIDVTVHDQTLIVRGKQDEQNGKDASYLHRGIAGRNFERRFQLADFVEVDGASIKDGLLHINLQREVPEAMKPRKIAITKETPGAGSEKTKKIASE